MSGVVGPFAWVMGSRVLREIDASNGQLGGRSQTQAGRIMGIVTTCLIALGLSRSWWPRWSSILIAATTSSS